MTVADLAAVVLATTAVVGLMGTCFGFWVKAMIRENNTELIRQINGTYLKKEVAVVQFSDLERRVGALEPQKHG